MKFEIFDKYKIFGKQILIYGWNIKEVEGMLTLQVKIKSFPAESKTWLDLPLSENFPLG